MLLVSDVIRERDDARELAAMYLHCLVSRALESGASLELEEKFLRAEFAESPWLAAEYKRLADDENAVRKFCAEARLG